MAEVVPLMWEKYSADNEHTPPLKTTEREELELVLPPHEIPLL